MCRTAKAVKLSTWRVRGSRVSTEPSSRDGSLKAKQTISDPPEVMLTQETSPRAVIESASAAAASGRHCTRTNHRCCPVTRSSGWTWTRSAPSASSPRYRRATDAPEWRLPVTGTTSAGTVRLADDLVLTRIGYGAIQLAGPMAWGPPKDRDAAKSVLRAVVDLGITQSTPATTTGRTRSTS
jgi:hypothetical protein